MGIVLNERIYLMYITYATYNRNLRNYLVLRYYIAFKLQHLRRYLKSATVSLRISINFLLLSK